MDYNDPDLCETIMALSLGIYKAFADCRDYGFRDQTTRIDLSVFSNIAEGLKRLSDKETVQFLSIVRGSAAELKTQLLTGLIRRYKNSN